MDKLKWRLYSQTTNRKDAVAAVKGLRSSGLKAKIQKSKKIFKVVGVFPKIDQLERKTRAYKRKKVRYYKLSVVGDDNGRITKKVLGRYKTTKSLTTAKVRFKTKWPGYPFEVESIR